LERLFFLALPFFLACNPATTRPDFLPLPSARTGTVDAGRQQLVPEVAAWLAAAGFSVAARSVEDGYVETRWQRAPAGQPVKLRAWVDPYVPGTSTLVVEVVYRPFVDPSRPARELEAAVPRDHPDYGVGERLIEAMRKRFGAPPEG
jgi:hypothetical protein